jgi:hypothetical protein
MNKLTVRWVSEGKIFHAILADLMATILVNKLLRRDELQIIAEENEVPVNELIMCAFEQDYLPGF